MWECGEQGLTLALQTRILRVGELRGWFAQRKSGSTLSGTRYNRHPLNQAPRQNLRKAII
jgi:hypothetical protein